MSNPPVEFQAARAPHSSERRLAAILDATPDLVATCDLAGSVLYVNAAGRRLLGYGPDEDLSRHNLAEMVAPWVLVMYQDEAFPTAIREGTWNGEATLLSREGRSIPVAQTLLAHRDERGEVEYFSTIARDMSDSRGAQEPLQRALQRLRYHVENTPLAVIEWDANLNIIGWSPQAEALFGWKADEVIGRNISELRIIYEEDVPEVLALIGQLVSGGVPRAVFRNRNRRQDGLVIHCEWYNSALTDETGRAITFLSFALDVTERKQAHDALRLANDELESRVRERTRELALLNQELRGEIESRKQVEEELRLSEERYRAFLTASVQGLWRAYPDGRVSYVSDEWEELSGVPTERLLGEGWLDIIHPHDRPHITARWQDALANQNVYETEVRILRRDGAARDYYMRGVPIFNPDWSVREWVGAGTDITERKAAERLKTELVATVSHELRTPLASLRGFAELMLTREFAPEKEREILSVIHAESLRLTRLVNDFLDIQRIEAGHGQYDFADLPLAPILREQAEAIIRPETAHSLRLELDDQLPPAHADADRLRQVVANLVSNAVKFSPDGGLITVGARREGERLIAYVADEGIGIPPSALPHLFTKFFRVDNRETRRIGGTGLGLMLVKEIIAAHQGQVWAESRLGQGSTFYFSLPLNKE